MNQLTTRGLATLRPNQWASDGGARGAGTLVARGLKRGGVMFYFRHVDSAGKRINLPLGGTPAMSLRAARDRAAELSLRYRAGERDLADALKAEERERVRQRHAAERAEADQSRRTLGALLTAYVEQMERDGKISAGDVRRGVQKHIRDAWPKLWGTPLADVTADDLLSVVAKPANEGKLTQADRLRSYLRAAYAAAVRARHNAKALPALRDLRLTMNPAAALVPIEGANNARDRALSLAELRAYWARIQTPELAALRFHLLTGCQRIRQLARATLRDVDHDTHSLRLLDPKGRRRTPRVHHVPLLPEALEAMRGMQAGAAGPHVFTFTGGQSGIDPSGMAKRIKAVALTMDRGGELPGGMFTAGALRRTVETRLADVGISRDVRAHLQSHGLGGVQNRHYDRADYLPQTRAALETLRSLITGEGADVVPLWGRQR